MAMWALIESASNVRTELFPCKLKRYEQVRVITNESEIEYYFHSWIAPPQIVNLYLMHDERTELYKIGLSKNPQYRERTLQSDNPLISLLDYWKVEKWLERYWHKQFESQRIRGEWFRLSGNDVARLCRSMPGYVKDAVEAERLHRGHCKSRRCSSKNTVAGRMKRFGR